MLNKLTHWNTSRILLDCIYITSWYTVPTISIILFLRFSSLNVITIPRKTPWFIFRNWIMVHCFCRLRSWSARTFWLVDQIPQIRCTYFSSFRVTFCCTCRRYQLIQLPNTYIKSLHLYRHSPGILSDRKNLNCYFWRRGIKCVYLLIGQERIEGAASWPDLASSFYGLIRAL